MDGNTVSEAEVQDWLRTLGITSLCQWDVVVFLYRHRDSLMGADHLAHLLGYETAFIVGAMEELEALGLLRRSRISKGARFYHFIPPSETHHITALGGLLAFTHHQPGRWRLSRLLRRGGQTAHVDRRVARTGPASQPQRKGITWLKAI
jgi:hypothetical protein